jgi:FkbM family methyltransferase
MKRNIRGLPFGIFLKHALSEMLSSLSFIIPDKHFPVNFYGGKIFLNLKESPMMRRRALGVYEYWKTRLFMDLVKPGMTVVDIGANKGYFSLLSAMLMNDRGRVISFEPSKDNCFWIRKSIQANDYKCIKLYQCALSDKKGQATFYPGKKSGWGSLRFSAYSSASKKQPITIHTQRLDDVLNTEGINNINILKIDVEGADFLVLKGAENTLRKSHNMKLIMDIDVRGKEKKQLFDFLTSCDFKIYKIDRELKAVTKIDEVRKDIYAVKHNEII